MYDIIIVGAGTAGLSAAIYGTRAGKKVLILEAKVFGGQIINSKEVENYPGIAHISGFDFANNLYQQAIELGAELRYEKVIKIQNEQGNHKVYTEKSEYEAQAVILATGAQNRPLGVDREKEMIGAGISYCATCDGAFFRGKEVAVFGGGNTALEDAMFLSNYCSHVTVIHRRQEFRGEEKLLLALKEKENVGFVLDSVVVALEGEETLTGVRVRNVQTEEERTIPVEGLFVAIGQIPDNGPFANVASLDEKGYIKASEDCQTQTPGVFTAGDCRTKTVRQLTTAASDGAVAALAACSFIDE